MGCETPVRRYMRSNQEAYAGSDAYPGRPPDFYARLKYFTETLPACEGYLNPFCYKAKVFTVVNNQPDQQY